MTVPTQRVRTLQAHQGAVHACCFSRNGRYLFSCGQDRSVRLWNPHKNSISNNSSISDTNAPTNHPETPQGTLVATFSGAHGYPVLDVCVSPDSSQFGTCQASNAGPFLWNTETQQVARRFSGHTQRVNCVAFNNQLGGSVLASGSYDGTVRLWDCRSKSGAPLQGRTTACQM
jgi:mitogen-activated protein kinase organizer 1